MTRPTVSSDHNNYLRDLRDLMQEAVKQTQRFDAKWNRLNDELKTKFLAEGVREPQLTELMNANLEFTGALAAGNWWRDKATYLANVIQAEIAMRREGL